MSFRMTSGRVMNKARSRQLHEAGYQFGRRYFSKMSSNQPTSMVRCVPSGEDTIVLHIESDDRIELADIIELTFGIEFTDNIVLTKRNELADNIELTYGID